MTHMVGCLRNFIQKHGDDAIERMGDTDFTHCIIRPREDGTLNISFYHDDVLIEPPMVN